MLKKTWRRDDLLVAGTRFCHSLKIVGNNFVGSKRFIKSDFRTSSLAWFRFEAIRFAVLRENPRFSSMSLHNTGVIWVSAVICSHFSRGTVCRILALYMSPSVSNALCAVCSRRSLQISASAKAHPQMLQYVSSNPQYPYSIILLTTTHGFCSKIVSISGKWTKHLVVVQG